MEIEETKPKFYHLQFIVLHTKLKQENISHSFD